ncbi:tRNA lysidine(34) synthetase TilS [Asticcacaulis sp. BYS171W]|uniref:tRNA(Ile)-lysidine synthase n=1 Tax=Asticcacaulis aquaticus TaxID=2984212 RepID=A0ABT5HVJ6_9CAUL|nr:tRNA lysidine(34) synthetase TilS [Asticcacaulis aquaticus]MDC7684074.1 tRNA lysidine(34) synthetase TilS [Asticcacaulis aquaticus]
MKQRLAATLGDFPDVAASLSLFPEYMNGAPETPIGVAVSGGGDSVALLMLLALWGKRPLEVFCVDHGLNPASAHWTQGVADLCADLGADLGLSFTALHWTGDKPATGVQAAARRARHHLILKAARAKGIKVLCLGHNADDGAEAEAMRAEGSTVGTPRLWSASPFWPEGEGVFYFRPLIGVARARLRAWLTAAGVPYIDDPANDNPAYLRAKVRQVLQASAPSVSGATRADTSPASQGRMIAHISSPVAQRTGEVAGEVPSEGANHLIHVGAFQLSEVPPADRLAAMIVCAGGGEKLPSAREVAAILDGISAGRTVFTLCGARIEVTRDGVLICREPGDMTRNGTVPAVVGDIWDGRFRLLSYAQGGEIRPLRGHAKRLQRADREKIAHLPPVARASLPIVLSGDTPRLMAAGDLHCLVSARLRAALGAALGQVRNEISLSNL